MTLTKDTINCTKRALESAGVCWPRKSPVYKFISSEQLEVVDRAITYAELETDGEIVVHIVGDSQGFDGKSDADKVAARTLTEFEQLGIQQTENATGILIMLSVKEQRVEILADSAINDKVQAEQWQLEVDKIVKAAKSGYPVVGIIDAVLSVGRQLAIHFPKTHDRDELSNKVQIVE